MTDEEGKHLAADIEAFRQEYPAWKLWSTTRRLDWFSLWRLSDELMD